MAKIKAKIALVTGASSGIGEATAERLAKAGYKVYGTSRRGAQAGRRLFEMLPLDVTSDESVAAAVGEVMRLEGRIDLLVNNAGFGVAPAGAEESSLDQARSIFETNFFGLIRMTRAVVPHMRRQGNGRIAPAGAKKPDEILVRVHAAGLNPIDYMIAKGTFKPILRFELPATMGSDLAGVVVEVGSRVTRFKPGDAVFASTFDLGKGALAELAVVPENAAALKPANLDFVQAASIPMVGLTSWQALKERAHLKPGQKVFIPAGAGGIGTFAIQLAKVLGASVGTTTSTGNVDLVRSLGADEVIDYKKQEFEDVLRDYDAVLGTVRGDALEKSLRVLKPKSTIVSLIGPPDAAFARARGMNHFMAFVFGMLSRKILRHARKRGVTYSFLFVHPDGSQLAEIGELLKSGRIRPVIDKIFPFEQAKEALAYLEQGRAKGKVVVQMT